jgi:hypothetical protein
MSRTSSRDRLPRRSSCRWAEAEGRARLDLARRRVEELDALPRRNEDHTIGTERDEERREAHRPIARVEIVSEADVDLACVEPHEPRRCRRDQGNADPAEPGRLRENHLGLGEHLREPDDGRLVLVRRRAEADDAPACRDMRREIVTTTRSGTAAIPSRAPLAVVARRAVGDGLVRAAAAVHAVGRARIAVIARRCRAIPLIERPGGGGRRNIRPSAVRRRFELACASAGAGCGPGEGGSDQGSPK